MSMPTEPFTGFGDDPNWSVKFRILGQSGSVRDWTSSPRTSVLPLATGNRTIRQRRGRDPWTIDMELLFDTSDELEALDAMVGTTATLRCRWGMFKRMGGSLEMIAGDAYLTLTDVYLASLDEHTGYINYPGGRRKATARFEREYVDPAPFVPPTWPTAPYPGVRVLPDPTLLLTQPFSRNAAGTIFPSAGAARPVTLSGYGAWRLIPAAKNAIRNPIFVGTGQWQLLGGATLTANGDGTARMQGSAAFDSVDQLIGTGLPAVQGETVTVVADLKSRTTNKTINMQLFAHSANNYGGNTTDLQQVNKAVTTSWQQFSVTRTLTDAATQFTMLRLTNPTATATDVDIRAPMLFKGSVIPEAIPAVVGGVLQVGDTWDGTANASTSTRTAGSVSAALASFGSLYVRWSADGTTVTNTVLTGPGSLGSSGTVAYSGGVLTITSPNQLWLGAAIAYPGTLTVDQITYLNSQPTSALTWTM